MSLLNSIRFYLILTYSLSTYFLTSHPALGIQFKHIEKKVGKIKNYMNCRTHKLLKTKTTYYSHICLFIVEK